MGDGPPDCLNWSVQEAFARLVAAVVENFGLVDDTLWERAVQKRMDQTTSDQGAWEENRTPDLRITRGPGSCQAVSGVSRPH